MTNYVKQAIFKRTRNIFYAYVYYSQIINVLNGLSVLEITSLIFLIRKSPWETLHVASFNLTIFYTKLLLMVLCHSKTFMVSKLRLEAVEL